MTNQKPCQRQHYVSQFYLRQFADPMFSQNLQVFLCKTGEWETRTSKGVGWSPHLLSYYNDEGRRTDEFDQYLKRTIEDPAAPVLRKLANAESITDDERNVAASFIALTASRTPEMLGSSIGDHVAKMSDDERKSIEGAAEAWCASSSLKYSASAVQDFLKPSQLGAMLLWAQSVQKRLMAWKWHAVSTTVSHPFVTSDRPVFMERDNGISLVGFPVSSTNALIIYSDCMLRNDHTLEENLRAVNFQTIDKATEFIVAPSQTFPGSDHLNVWRERALLAKHNRPSTS